MTAEQRFATMGELVDASEVPALVRAGMRVWSFGYDDNDPDGFTTIDESDLWAWEWDDEDGDATVDSWGPFRVEYPEHADHMAESVPGCPLCDETHDAEYVAHCPACGDPIDYCQGHGEIGDPAGAAILARHDDDDHADCHPAGCDEAPRR